MRAGHALGLPRPYNTIHAREGPFEPLRVYKPRPYKVLRGAIAC
jgi:hypothetical protein